MMSKQPVFMDWLTNEDKRTFLQYLIFDLNSSDQWSISSDEFTDIECNQADSCSHLFINGSIKKIAGDNRIKTTIVVNFCDKKPTLSAKGVTVIEIFVIILDVRGTEIPFRVMHCNNSTPLFKEFVKVIAKQATGQGIGLFDMLQIDEFADIHREIDNNGLENLLFRKHTLPGTFFNRQTAARVWPACVETSWLSFPEVLRIVEVLIGSTLFCGMEPLASNKLFKDLERNLNSYYRVMSQEILVRDETGIHISHLLFHIIIELNKSSGCISPDNVLCLKIYVTGTPEGHAMPITCHLPDISPQMMVFEDFVNGLAANMYGRAFDGSSIYQQFYTESLKDNRLQNLIFSGFHDSLLNRKYCASSTESATPEHVSELKSVTGFSATQEVTASNVRVEEICKAFKHALTLWEDLMADNTMDAQLARKDFMQQYPDLYEVVNTLDLNSCYPKLRIDKQENVDKSTTEFSEDF